MPKHTMPWRCQTANNRETGRAAFLRHGLVAFLSTLFCLLASAEPAHAAFGDCSDASYRALFDPRIEPIAFDCVERVRIAVSTDSGNREIRLLHDRNAGWAILPGVVDEFARGVRAAAAALPHIGSFDMDDVTILLIDDLTPREGSTDSFSDIAAWADAGEGECRISVYLLGPGSTVEHAAYIAAHEIFHCVQFATLSAAQMSTGSSGTGGGGDWWLEGSAEWFAALALPHATVVARQVAAFDRASINMPLYEMAYEALVFFFWRNDAEGPTSILPFLRQMASRSGASAQRYAMASAMTQEAWLTFAQHYIDGDIKHPHGSPLSIDPAPGDTWRYTETRTQDIALEPFVIHRGWVEFDCGKWAAQAQPIEGRAFRTEGERWGELPDRIDVNSGNASRYRFVGLHSGRSGTTVRLRGEQEAGCEPCGGLEAIDECLVGAWRETGGGPIEWMRKVMKDSISIPEGERRNAISIFQSDGTYMTTPVTADITSIAETSHGTLRGDGNVVAQTSGRWSGEAGRLNLCQDHLRASGTVRATSSDGMDQTFQVPMPAAPDVVTMEFSCSGSSLETRLPIPGTAEPIVTQYTRISVPGDD